MVACWAILRAEMRVYRWVASRDERSVAWLVPRMVAPMAVSRAALSV